MQKTSAICILIWAMISAHAVASEDDFWHGTKPPSKAVRRSAARQFSDFVTPINAAVPKLSPSQRTWINDEFVDEIAKAGNIYTPRAINAMDTKEYDIYVAKERLQAMTVALSELINSKLMQREEVTRWTRVAVCFTDKELWQAVESLVSRGVIPEKYVGSDRRVFFENQTIKAQYILNRIVVPVLEGSLSQ